MSWFDAFDKAVEEYLPDLQVEKDEPMSRHTSFRIGGPARRIAYPESGPQLVLLVNFARECGARPLVIGNGSNLLIPDTGLDRLVIDTSRKLHNMDVSDPTHIRAESGTVLARLADLAQKRGLSGLEFAHGIPGTVGGAVCMNAGAYDGEMKQVVTSVTVLDPDSGVRKLSGEEMDFSYRHSILTEHPDWIVLEAEFQLRPGDPAEIRGKMEELMGRRKASQPLEYPSAGSTFKRPVGYFAGTMIDQCGLKGLTVGGAQVSEKHAGFIINRGGATFADVIALIEAVQKRVQTEKGVRLEPEVRVIQD